MKANSLGEPDPALGEDRESCASAIVVEIASELLIGLVAVVPVLRRFLATNEAQPASGSSEAFDAATTTPSDPNLRQASRCARVLQVRTEVPRCFRLCHYVITYHAGKLLSPAV